MENRAFAEHTVKNTGHSYRGVRAKDVENAILAICEELAAVKTFQHSYRDDTDGVFYFLTLQDETVGDITIEIQPARLSGPQSFTQVYHDQPVTAVAVGEPFWIDDAYEYAELRIRTTSFTQAYSAELMATARTFAARVANRLTEKLWSTSPDDSNLAQRLGGLSRLDG